MIVYVESNFVLELAFLQEHCDSCDAIVELASAERIQLIIPAFSIWEPYTALKNKSDERKRLHDRLSAEIQELGRSKPYSQVQNDLREATAILIRRADEEKQRLDAVTAGLIECSQVIPFGIEILKSATVFQSSLTLSFQDSIVYASVLNHLSLLPSPPKCFLNKNSKDFLNPIL